MGEITQLIRVQTSRTQYSRLWLKTLKIQDNIVSTAGGEYEVYYFLVQIIILILFSYVQFDMY